MNILKTLKEKSKDNGLDVSCHQNKLVTFLNPYSYKFYRKKISIFSHFDYLYIDGIVLVLLLRLISKKVVRNSFDMTSMAPKVFDYASKTQSGVYFIGAKQSEISGFVNTIKNKFSNLNIVGYRNGYFKNDDEINEVVQKINTLNPSIIVVGMGTPMQETFLLKLRNEGWNGTGYTCGGFFHQTIDDIDYYPHFFDKFNLRWLYRIYDEPKLFKRYFLEYPKSIFLFKIDLLRYLLKSR